METSTYRIRITKTEESIKDTKEYQRISDTGGEDGKTKYGYVPVSKIETEEIEVLDIAVTNLKLNDVLKAILENSQNR